MMDDDDLASAGLHLRPPEDVSAARAQRLRERCHRELRRRTAPEPARRSPLVWRRMIGPALIGAWGVIYLIETFRSAAALYGLF
jgi:hypothetical protein